MALCDLSFSSGDTPEDVGKQTITYHSNNGSGLTVSKTYYGIASTEYNPEYWSVTDKWGGATVTTSAFTSSSVKVVERITWSLTTASEYFVIYLDDDNIKSVTVSDVSAGSLRYYGSPYNYLYYIPDYDNKSGSATITISLNSVAVPSMTVNKVFGGWSTTSSGSAQYLPGDVVPDTVKDLYAVWVTPDYFVNVDNLSKITSYSNSWDVSGIAATISSTHQISKLSDFNGLGVVNEDGRSEPDMYATVYEIAGSDGINTGNVTIPAGTYHGNGSQTINIGKVSLSGNTIIDNVKISGTDYGSHGDGSSSGIFASGHILILGDGITSNQSASSGKVAPLIVGGSSSSSITQAVIEDKAIVSNTGSFSTLSVDLGTCVIVHSGVYGNIVGGGVGQDIGTSSTNLSTYVVLKGGAVIDTVVGGCGGSATVYGGAGTASEKQGGTFVYALGVEMFGDDYEENALGYGVTGYGITESTIMEGGASSGTVIGSSHVFLSDKTSIWDVQAGGRRYSTSLSFAYMEISGKAVVKHMACGTITDPESENVITVIADSSMDVTVTSEANYGHRVIPDSSGIIVEGDEVRYDTTVALTPVEPGSVVPDIDGRTVQYSASIVSGRGDAYHGTITVSVPVGDGYDGREFVVYCVNSAGETEIQTVVCADGYVTLTTPSMSSFLVAYPDEVAASSMGGIVFAIVVAILLIMIALAWLLVRTVTFVFNGGMSADGRTSKTAVRGMRFGKLPTPVRSGSAFGGWYLDPACAIPVTAETKVPKDRKISIYAKWI